MASQVLEEIAAERGLSFGPIVETFEPGIQAIVDRWPIEIDGGRRVELGTADSAAASEDCRTVYRGLRTVNPALTIPGADCYFSASSLEFRVWRSVKRLRRRECLARLPENDFPPISLVARLNPTRKVCENSRSVDFDCETLDGQTCA